MVVNEDNIIIDKSGKRSVLVLNRETLREEYKDLDKFLNQLEIPSLTNSINEIFVKQGLVIENYHLKAQPYESVFLLHVRKFSKKSDDLFITLSISDMINKGWKGNKKLSQNIKKVLEYIHRKFVEPKIDNWKLALREKQFDHPLQYQPYVTGTRKVKLRSSVLCPIDRETKDVFDHCMRECDHFIRFTSDGVECKRIIKIPKF